MKLIFHLFKKDVRRLWILLALWAVALLLEAGLIFAGQAAMNRHIAWQMIFTMAGMFIPLLQWLVILILVPILIHQEPLVGTTAYWMSRPISSSMLIRSKGLFIGIFLIVLPLVLELAVFVANDVSGYHLMLAVPEILLQLLSMVAGAAALAVVTSNYGKFILWLALFWVGSTLLGTAFTISQFFGEDGLLGMNTQMNLFGERMIIHQLMTAIFGLGIVVHQYWTRQTRRTAGLIIVLGLLATIAQMCWPWPFLKAMKEKPVERLADSGVDLKIQSVYAHDMPSFRPGSEKERSVNLLMRIHTEKAWDVKLHAEEISWKYPNGKEIILRGNKVMEGMSGWNEGTSRQVLESLFPGVEIFGKWENPMESVSLKGLDSIDFQKYGELAAHVTGNIEIQLYSYEVEARIPLKEGEMFRRGSESIRLAEILKEPAGLTVLLRRRDVNLLLDGKKNPQWIVHPQQEIFYALHHPERKELVVTDRDLGDFNLDVMMSQMRLQSTPVRLSFLGSNGSSVPHMDEEWIRGAELLRFRIVKKAVADFKLDQEGVFLAGEKSYRMEEEGKDRVEKKISAMTLKNPADREEVRNYIRQLTRLSAQLPRKTSKSVALEPLTRVGVENLDLLLEEMSEENEAVEMAIRTLATDAQKDLVISHLRNYPHLISVVIDKGWTESAAPVLKEGLKEKREIPVEWVRVVLRMKDPATYPDLHRWLVENDQRVLLLGEARGLPGMDLGETVASAWKRAKYGEEWQCRGMIPVAIEYGHADALEMAAGFLEKKESGDSDQVDQMRKVIRKTTSAPSGDDAALAAWIRWKKGAFHWNPETQKFE